MAEAATTGDAEDQLSPTTIVLNALRKAGVPITPDNIRRYVAGSMRQGNEAGTDIQGLRIENPGESPGSAVRGSIASGARGNKEPPLTRPVPSTNTGSQDPAFDVSPNRNSPQTTSAPASPVGAGQTAADAAMRAAVPRVPVTEPLPSSTNLPTAPNAAGPNGEYVGNAQPASGRQMTINPDALPGPRNPALSPPPSAALPSPLEQAMIEALSGPQPQGMLPPPPRQITGPPSAPEAPMAQPNTPIPMPGAQAPPGLQIENVPMPPPQQTIQAPPASSIPPSGGLSIEDRMMPGRGNLTIQAPSAGSMPPTQAPVIQETRPILDKIIRGGATGAGAGRLAGPYGAVAGGVLGAIPGLWDLGKHIVGR